MKQEKKCGIVILNYNTPGDTINCVKSILSHNTAPVKIVIVDNASTDDSVKLISDAMSLLTDEFCSFYETNESLTLPFISLIQAKCNAGYACGNNCGINVLKKDDSIESILVLNSDILFIQDIIPTLLEDLERTKASVVCPVLYKKDLVSIDYTCAREKTPYSFILLHFLLSAHEPKFLKNKLYILKSKTKREGLLPIGLPSGSCMLFSKELCQEIGIFDSNTFLYYEENIIAEEIEKKRKNGIFIDMGLKCVHLGATSTRKEPSRKIVEAEVSSARYFIYKYSECFLYKFVFSLVCKWYLLLDSLKRFFKGKRK